MKIALFSDIHANLPAFEALMDDIELKKPDAIYCLGDLVGYNVWPNEVIHEIRKRGIPTIAGNYDFGVGRNSDDCGCAYKTDEEKALGAQSIAFTNSGINEEERSYLRMLPAHIKLEFQLNKGVLFLYLVHGSPRRINEYIYEDREEKSMLRILESASTDILFFGHTHLPFHRILEYEIEGRKAYRHAVNIGSVGKPKDGDPRGGYVILHLNPDSTKYEKDSLEIEFVRFAYDIEKAAKAIEESILPDAFAEMLRKG